MEAEDFLSRRAARQAPNMPDLSAAHMAPIPTVSDPALAAIAEQLARLQTVTPEVLMVAVDAVVQGLGAVLQQRDMDMSPILDAVAAMKTPDVKVQVADARPVTFSISRNSDGLIESVTARPGSKSGYTED